MTESNPYAAPIADLGQVQPKLPGARVLFAGVAATAMAGAIAGAFVGYAIGEAADQFHLTYFGTPPRDAIVAETVVGLGIGGVLGASLGLIFVAVIYWIRGRLRRRRASAELRCR